MTEKRRTYKKRLPQSKKLVRVTFRVTEEEQDRILSQAHEAGFSTESEYLRHLCCFPETSRITDAELRELKTDINYCKEWIEENKDVIENAISALHLALKLFS